jgi:hypothetical protein
VRSVRGGVGGATRESGVPVGAGVVAGVLADVLAGVGVPLRRVAYRWVASVVAGCAWGNHRKHKRLNADADGDVGGSRGAMDTRAVGVRLSRSPV